MSVLRLDCPWFIILPRVRVKDKSICISLNKLLEMHHMKYNECKIEFKNMMQAQFFDILGERRVEKVYVHYVVHPKTKAMHDTFNLASGVSKYLLDALSEYGFYRDDDYKTVVFESAETGGIFREPVICAYISESPIYSRIKDLDENDYS